MRLDHDLATSCPAVQRHGDGGEAWRVRSYVGQLEDPKKRAGVDAHRAVCFLF